MITSRRIRWAGNIERMEMRNTYKIVVRTAEGNTPPEGLRRRWEDNVNINLKEIGWKGVDWINLAQGGFYWQALVNTLMNIWIPQRQVIY
jgi:hypothetical protein